MPDLNAARDRFRAIQAETDRDDLRHTPITLPRPSMTDTELRQLASDNAAFAQDIASSLGLIFEHAAQGLAALTDAPAPAPSPPPEPVPTPFPPFSRQTYGTGPRQWLNLGLPTAPATGVGLLMVHGGGWMQGDPNVALPAMTHGATLDHWQKAGFHFGGPDEAIDSPLGPLIGLRAMSSVANSWGWVTVEPAYTYSTGNPDVCLADVKRAIAWAIAHAAQLGVTRWLYAGHSAGGQLAIRAALDPSIPAPVAAIGLCAAGLDISSMSDVVNAPQPTPSIFATAWNGGDWSRYSPHTHLRDRPERFNLLLEVGDLGNGSDGSVLRVWASRFADVARAAQWPVTLRVQPGQDHFSAARFDQNPTTAADIRALVA